jgi:hypothetical protein
MLKSTQFPSYDASLITLIRAWAFRPFEELGQPAAVCSVVSTVFHRLPTAP